MGFSQEMSETKTSVAQLASWCLTVALHQEFGIGAGRLERLAKVLRRIQEENVAAVLGQGTEAAVRQREGWIQGKVQMDFPVPLLRAPRTRREKQLRMAGDEAAATAWQIYAAGVLAVSGISHTDAEKGEIFARCAAETANLWRHR